MAQPRLNPRAKPGMLVPAESFFTSKAPVAIGESIEYMITLPKAPGTRSDVRLRCVGKVIRGEQPARYAATLERFEFVRQKN